MHSGKLLDICIACKHFILSMSSFLMFSFAMHKLLVSVKPHLTIFPCVCCALKISLLASHGILVAKVLALNVSGSCLSAHSCPRCSSPNQLPASDLEKQLRMPKPLRSCTHAGDPDETSGFGLSQLLPLLLLGE